MGTAIVVTSGKGGTGKTSLTGGVASCLAALGHRTLCLDADIGMRNLDLTLGLSDSAFLNFNDVINGTHTIEQAAVAHERIEGLYLITAPVALAPSEISREKMVWLIREIKKSFDFCLIDAPAGIGSGFKLAACGADKAVVVATPDQSSLRAAQRVTAELEKLGINDVGLVANRIKSKTIDTVDTTIDDMMDEAGLPLLGVVPEDEAVFLAANLGDPVVLYEKRVAAVAYLHIAKRLEGKKVPLMKIK